MAEPRTHEGRDSRQSEARPQSWTPPSVLPDPQPHPDWSYRWIRTSMMGQSDNINVSKSFREGFEACRAEDHPELMVMTDQGSRFPGNIEIGGLLLCRIPRESMETRAAYFDAMARNQAESVDNNLMRESDPRMPLSRPERKSRIKFGSGAKHD